MSKEVFLHRCLNNNDLIDFRSFNDISTINEGFNIACMYGYLDLIKWMLVNYMVDLTFDKYKFFKSAKLQPEVINYLFDFISINFETLIEIEYIPKLAEFIRGRNTYIGMAYRYLCINNKLSSIIELSNYIELSNALHHTLLRILIRKNSDDYINMFIWLIKYKYINEFKISDSILKYRNNKFVNILVRYNPLIHLIES